MAVLEPRFRRSPYNARVTLPRLAAAAAAVFVVACALSACGGGGSSSSRASASGSDFQPAQGKTIADLRRGLAAGPILAPTVSVLTPGANRFGFGLFDHSHRQVGNASVAVYIERSGTAHVDGPFVATRESLAVAPRFQSDTVKNDPDSAKSLYVTQVRFPSAGTYVVQGIAKIRGRLVASDPIPVMVSRTDPVPAVGQLAPRVHTPTVASAHGDISAIETRQPPDSMHTSDLYDVYGRKPVILLFATPALCQSRVCGPVTDLAEEVKASGAKAVFIHNEIYLGNTIKPGCLEGTRPQDQCVRPQVLAYHLPSEPWLFAIDRHGRIVARLEGAFDKQELDAAVKRAVSG
jgi:hypothetical protein